jgi:16S rRNA (cytidine1402-2'-O)-methyltransferase
MISETGERTSGTLYVVATPIGNLSDWTRRAEEVVGAVDLILCEDTRHTRKLLARYRIGGTLGSYHDFNETGKVRTLVSRLLGGTSIALISDAGTPTISDPGYRLVRACRERGVPVLPIPGASAAVAALSVSGLPTDEFLFVGFLPPRKQARRRKLESLATQNATLVFYEASRRLRATLEDILDVLGNREVFLGREMTKLHEEYRFGPVRELVDQVTERGEAVIVVDGASDGTDTDQVRVDLNGLSRQEVLKLAARRLSVGRKQLYDILFKKDDD